MTRIVWAVCAVLWLLFFSWYTSFEGPLTPEEIDLIMSRVQENGSASPAEIARLRRFVEEDTGDDFVMVNAILLKDPPDQVGDVQPGETANQVLARYMEYMWPALLSRACHPVLMGQAANRAMDVWGIENAEDWTQAGLMRYRSRRDLFEIAGNPAFQGRHEYKFAAMEKTIAFPIDPWFQLGDPRLVLGLVLFGVAASVQMLAGRRG